MKFAVEKQKLMVKNKIEGKIAFKYQFSNSP